MSTYFRCTTIFQRALPQPRQCQCLDTVHDTITMFGGLYGDLPQAKGSSDSDAKQQGWALSNTKQPAPRSTVASLAPPSLLRAGRGGQGRGPPPGTHTPHPHTQQTAHTGRGRTGRGPPAATRSVLDPHGQVPAAPAVSAVTPAEDEYDPARCGCDTLMQYSTRVAGPTTMSACSRTASSGASRPKRKSSAFASWNASRPSRYAPCRGCDLSLLYTSGGTAGGAQGGD